MDRRRLKLFALTQMWSRNLKKNVCRAMFYFLCCIATNAVFFV